MKTFYLLIFLPVLSFSQIYQVRAFGGGSDTSQNNYQDYGSNPQNLFDLNGILLFKATENFSYGNELFRSDGSYSGTNSVLPINNGYTNNGNSDPQFFTKLNNEALFSATNGTDNQGTELWITDGVPTYDGGSTFMLKDINPNGNSNPQNFKFINPNTVLFSANNGVSGIELWKTDGTEDGTVNVIDYNGAGNSISWIENLNGIGILGQNISGTGRELYKSDGTAAGSGLILDINPGNASGCGTAFHKAGNIIYLQGITPFYGNELWKTDGTAAGTSLVSDINDGSSSSNPSSFQNVGNTIYFKATTGEFGSELWKSDGTQNGTSLVSDINIGFASSNPNQIAAINGNLYFFATDDGIHYDLYNYNGTNLIKLANFNAGFTTVLTNFILLNSVVYFAVDSDNDGKRELWQTNGTTAGTVSLQSVYIGTISPINVSNLVLCNGKIFFSSQLAGGMELYAFDNLALKTNILNLENLSIYPNPTTGNLNIETNLNAKIKYTISDLLGKTIANGDVQNNQINFEAQKGIYLLKLESEGSSIVKKIIKN